MAKQLGHGAQVPAASNQKRGGAVPQPVETQLWKRLRMLADGLKFAGDVRGVQRSAVLHGPHVTVTPPRFSSSRTLLVLAELPLQQRRDRGIAQRHRTPPRTGL